MKNAVIILAAGFGKRFCDEIYDKSSRRIFKQFLDINGKPVFLWSVETFESIKTFEQIIIVVPPMMIDELSLRYKKYKANFIIGGNERFDSVKKALSVVNRDIDFIAIHDAARPLISRKDILAVLRSAKKTGAAVAVEKIKDTVKLVSCNDKKNINSKYILKTLDRTVLRNAQTPQIFKSKIIKKAYFRNVKKIIAVTDDSQLVENLKINVSVVETKFPNFKITTRQDFELAIAVFFLNKRY
ncbi:MAG: 2-C-methyl-D-erythritol 4-phosphate cytidylyltransferase [Endomicrobium sp.]|jgi:2-C-methyl-D-erythritol 4-phosphate cytidylyltransferase|nr:2-C-methyl-D-erythritol 4-phosphate cytidylyltransferase [Endomicrobium sp.]